MAKEKTVKRKKRLLKAAVVCFIAVAAFGLYAFIYNYNSYRTQSYKKSVKEINAIIAKQLDKDPNHLTSDDFLKQKNMVVLGSDNTNLNPLVKCKNLERIVFYGFEGIDLRPLSKLKKLKRLEIYFPTVAKQPKGKWYDKLVYKLGFYKPPKNEHKPFDFSYLKKLENLEWLELKKYDSLCNIKDIASLKNLEHLTLQPNRNKINAVIVITTIPQGKTTNVNYKTEPVDLSPLQSLSKLNYLDLLGMEAIDFSFIEKLSNLKRIQLASTNISEEQIEELKKTLPELEIVR